MLESELDFERRTNRENKQEMEKLEKDIEMVGEMGTKRECDLQNALDE